MIFLLFKNFLQNNIKLFYIYKNIISFLISFFLCLFLEKKFIFLFYKFNLIQKHKKINSKLDKNVPSMGGIFILFSIIITMILCNNYDNYFLLILITIISYGILGFIDDYIKISSKFSSNGLSIKHKYIIQSLLNIIISYFLYKILIKKSLINFIFIPFFGKIFIDNFILIFILIYFTIISSCNSMNFSDGLDGLSIKLMINLLFFIIITHYLFPNKNILINDILYTENIINICFIMIGSGLAFLWFNSYPSEIFMGDTGSLSLGSLIGVIFVSLRKELLLIIVGGIFIIETMSIIIQIISVRFFKKKVFLLAPLHHHYQVSGINESKIVTRFIIISIILNFIGLLSLIIN